ncbi:MAG: hypothetical protein P8L39_03390 [Halioglobus sp.]|nr:hypothetical protein [Halioglobus sp.]
MTDNNSTTRNRMVLLLIGGIPLTVALVATWLWYFVVRGDLDLVNILGTANRGELVQPPRQLDDQVLLDGSGRAITLSEMEPRWTMLVPSAGGRCDEACERNLYLTRQIRVAMGKHFNRLRRFYVEEEHAGSTELLVSELSDGRPAPAAAEFGQYLSAEHPGLKVLAVSSAGYKALFDEQSSDASTWYLADPAGWIMMSYNAQVPYKDVIADLKFLLKNSGG